MKSTALTFSLHATASILAIATPTAPAETYHLYFLAGQSNMDGYGYTRDLPADLNTAVPETRIFLGQLRGDHQPAGGVGTWTTLTPGFGVGASTDGTTVQTSGRFGPELTFATRLRELRPDEHIAIIKYAKGGSSLDVRARGQWGTWDPDDSEPSPQGAHEGVNQYDHALATIEAATRVRDIDNDGEPDTLIPAGILWMQGETDATQAGPAADYADNLAQLADLLRAALRRDDLPFVIGRISDRADNTGEGTRLWTHMEIVRGAQAALAATDPHTALVTSTDNYGYSDPYHYDSEGYIDLGAKFAEAMNGLREAE